MVVGGGGWWWVVVGGAGLWWEAPGVHRGQFPRTDVGPAAGIYSSTNNARTFGKIYKLRFTYIELVSILILAYGFVHPF